MKAIILAAGRGSRMGSITDSQPKCMAKIRGMTLLQMQIETIRKAGISEIAIVTGYKHDMLDGHGLVEYYNADWMSTNMVASLMCAREWMRGDDCIVSYSDIFYDVSAITSLIESKAEISVTYDVNWLKLWECRFDDPLDDAETFKINECNNLVEIGKKPKKLSEIEGQYMGLLCFRARGWLEAERALSRLSDEDRLGIHMTDLLQKIIESGEANIKALPYDGKWGEVDTASDLDIYNKCT